MGIGKEVREADVQTSREVRSEWEQRPSLRDTEEELEEDSVRKVNKSKT